MELTEQEVLFGMLFFATLGFIVGIPAGWVARGPSKSDDDSEVIKPDFKAGDDE